MRTESTYWISPSPRGDQLADLAHRRRVAVGVVAHQDQAPLGRLDQLAPLGDRGGQRLLDQHVLAGFRPPGEARAWVRAGGDRDRLDRVVVEDPSTVGDRTVGSADGRLGRSRSGSHRQVGGVAVLEVADQVGAPVAGLPHADDAAGWAGSHDREPSGSPPRDVRPGQRPPGRRRRPSSCRRCTSWSAAASAVA